VARNPAWACALPHSLHPIRQSRVASLTVAIRNLCAVLQILLTSANAAGRAPLLLSHPLRPKPVGAAVFRQLGFATACERGQRCGRWGRGTAVHPGAERRWSHAIVLESCGCCFH
jgi:hypothetical protein